jgi:hypothetical protein
VKNFLFIFILAAMLLSSCRNNPQTPVVSFTQTAEEIMADMVASTLEAFALAAAKISQPDLGFAAPGEQHSVEVTQASTPQPGTTLKQGNFPHPITSGIFLATANFFRLDVKLQRRMIGRSILALR